MGWAVDYYLHRESPLTDDEREALRNHAATWQAKPWDWEMYRLSITSVPRGDGLLAWGFTKPDPNDDDYIGLAQLLDALTELRGVVSGATLWVRDDYGVVCWDDESQRFSHYSGEPMQDAPAFEVGEAGWEELSPELSDDRDRDEPADFYADDDDDEDDEVRDFFSDDDDEDDDERVELCVLTELPESMENRMLRVEGSGLRIEKRMSSHEDALVVSGRVTRIADGKLKIIGLVAILRDGEGRCIGCEDGYVDLAVSDSVDLSTSFRFRPGRLAAASTLTLRFEVEYSFKKLPLAAFKCHVAKQEGESEWRAMPVNLSHREEFPRYRVSVTGFVDRSYPEIELLAEVHYEDPELRDHGIDLLFAGFDQDGKRVAKDDYWASMPAAGVPAFVRKNLTDSDGLERIRQIQLSAKGELRALYEVGPFDLTS